MKNSDVMKSIEAVCNAGRKGANMMFRCDRCQRIFIIENRNQVRVNMPEEPEEDGSQIYDLCTDCLKHLKEALEPIKDFNADDCHFCHGS